MKEKKKTIQFFISMFIVVMGITVGSYLNLNAQTDLYICGFCDHASSVGADIDLTFCNTTVPALFNGCSGNDGSVCNPRECSVQLPQPPPPKKN